MLRKLLLASSLVASAVAMQAKEIYIIKDGKVAEGVELLDSENKFISIEPGVEAEGGEGTYLRYTTANCDKAQYAGRFFYVEDGVNLDEVWMCDITYFFPEGTVTHGDNLKRESMRLDFLGDTTVVEGVDTFGFDYNQVTRRFAHLGYDVYFRNFYEYNDETTSADFTGHGLGKDTKVSRYIFTQSNFRDALNSRNMVKAISLACGQESPATDAFPSVYYIKEIKLYGEGVKPFYNEPFHSAPKADYISGAGKNFFRYRDEDKTMVPFSDELDGYAGTDLYGGTYLAGTVLNKVKYGGLSCESVRLWQTNGEQCGNGFYDTEVGIMLNVNKASKRKDNPVYLRIPFTGAVAAGENINVHLILGHNACGDCEEYTAYDAATSASPLQYRFEKGDMNSYTDATEFTVFSAIDTLPISITTIDEEITVPEGDYNIVTLAFFPQNDVQYVVGDLQVRGSKTVAPVTFTKFEGEIVPAHQASMPFTFEPVTALKSVNAIAGIEIYPNPASAEFTVGGEVEKVEVISMTGSVLLSVDSNKVNIASLASGLYIVKAYTESGIKTGTVIKK